MSELPLDIERRYLYDPTFHYLVNTILAVCQDREFHIKPDDYTEAVMVAKEILRRRDEKRSRT